MDLFHHKLLNEGAQAEGVILEWHNGATVSQSRVMVGFQASSGDRLEFSQSIVDYVQMPAKGIFGSVNADVVPLPLVVGEPIPVRYRADDPTHAVIDETELHARAIAAHQQDQDHLRQRAEEQFAQRTPPRVQDAPVADAPVSTAAGDRVALLAQLADLHTRGVLTDAEFASEKRRLLAS